MTPLAVGAETKLGVVLRVDFSLSEEQHVYTIQTPVPHIRLRIGERQL